MDYLAHIRKSDAKKQFLHEHLADVAEISGRFASKIGLGKYGKIIGILYDVRNFYRSRGVIRIGYRIISDCASNIRKL